MASTGPSGAVPPALDRAAAVSWRVLVATATLRATVPRPATRFERTVA